MDAHVIDDLYRDLVDTTGIGTPARKPLRVWTLSGVERLHLSDTGTVIFKYAAAPFTAEDKALILAANRRVPVPQLHASTVRKGTLGMILEDLGAPLREATIHDGATAAARLHATGVVPGLDTLDQQRLAALPGQALQRVTTLRDSGRWTGVDDIADILHALSRCASARATGAQLAPFGFCHSEFHPTSLHIGEGGWRLLDFARAFNGPGLLDLASWHGTIDDPDSTRLRELLDAYADAGGHRQVLAPRGGLPAQQWALGWHRVWAVTWYLDQAVHWINDPATDPVYITAARRHLREAADLLAP
ncbi:hypothetical protein [Polymorphospora sp. NPDC050346]|uniref:hypothetical protein n=1 Tax=Polymorphospora sp. NPDC050346 TaxID=3155780 RepID=UPI0033C4EF3D